MIRDATHEDAQVIAEIYNYYVKNTAATFEEHEVTAQDMLSRIQSIQSEDLPWLVIEHDNRVIGYAYASRWKARSAYRFTVEVSVYLAHSEHGKGNGKALYTALFNIIRNKGFHVAISVVNLPNDSSVAIHEKFGMKKVAHFAQVGFKFGQWQDVGYWQITFDK